MIGLGCPGSSLSARNAASQEGNVNPEGTSVWVKPYTC